MLKSIFTAAALLAATASWADTPADPNILDLYQGGNRAGQAGKATLGDLRPPASYTGQWYVAPNGCSYSRAKAPGYAATWHLILNPHHIGQKPAHARCAAML